MPPVRIWRVTAFSTLFAASVLWYLHAKQNSGYSSYIPALPKHYANDWVARPDDYPVSSHIPYPTGSPKKIPTVQAKQPSEDAVHKAERSSRKKVVLDSFLHSWAGYKEHAWLRDEVGPLSGSYKDHFGGWAATLVDSLDTLWIMGLKEEFEIALIAIQDIDFTTSDNKEINIFETTIRYLGGFLGAYDISGGMYPILLEKAVEVGDLVMGAFDTPNRMPVSRWEWER